MAYVKIEQSSLEHIAAESKAVAQTMGQGAADLRETAARVDAAFATALGEIKRQTAAVRSALSDAVSARARCDAERTQVSKRIRPVPDLPPERNAQSPEEQARFAAALERRNEIERENAAAQRELSQSDAQAKALDGKIETLRRCGERLDALLTRVTAAATEHATAAAKEGEAVGRACRDMAGFCNAADTATVAAVEVLNVDVRGSYGRAVSFKIEADRGAAKGIRATGQAWDRPTDDVTVKNTDAARAYAAAESGARAVRVPAADLHALGGQTFLEGMAARGYAVVRKNGSMIGGDGMILFERDSTEADT